MTKRFKDKICIVTGASQGIGQGIAIAIAKEGGTVVIVSRNHFIEDTVKLIKKFKGKCLALQADVENFDGAKKVVDVAIEKYGRVDVSIHNVGGTIWAKPFEEYEEEQIIKEVNRSLFTTLWSCRAVLPHMIKQKSGSIVNISSIATRGIYRVPYSASKGGVNALTYSLAMEQAKHNIRVNAVASGGTEAPERKSPRNTDFIDEQQKAWYQDIKKQSIDSSLMKRYGTIDEQVNATLFLASDEASYITGTVLPVGGGDLGMG